MDARWNEVLEKAQAVEKAKPKYDPAIMSGCTIIMESNGSFEAKSYDVPLSAVLRGTEVNTDADGTMHFVTPKNPRACSVCGFDCTCEVEEGVFLCLGHLCLRQALNAEIAEEIRQRFDSGQFSKEDWATMQRLGEEGNKMGSFIGWATGPWSGHD